MEENRKSPAARPTAMDQMPKETKMENQSDDTPVRGSGEDAPVAKNPSMRRSELADPSAAPREKQWPSDLPAAEEEEEPRTAARQATGGTKGASASSEGRKGNAGNYGTDQFGPGLATGPLSGTPDAGNK